MPVLSVLYTSCYQYRQLHTNTSTLITTPTTSYESWAQRMRVCVTFTFCTHLALTPPTGCVKARSRRKTLPPPTHLHRITAIVPGSDAWGECPHPLRALMSRWELNVKVNIESVFRRRQGQVTMQQQQHDTNLNNIRQVGGTQGRTAPTAGLGLVRRG